MAKIMVSFIKFNQFLGGHDDDHEHEHEHSDCAFGHSHDENPIDYILCTTPKKMFGI